MEPYNNGPGCQDLQGGEKSARQRIRLLGCQMSFPLSQGFIYCLFFVSDIMGLAARTYKGARKVRDNEYIWWDV
jgi:hypothetical protein